VFIRAVLNVYVQVDPQEDGEDNEAYEVSGCAVQSVTAAESDRQIESHESLPFPLTFSMLPMHISSSSLSINSTHLVSYSCLYLSYPQVEEAFHASSPPVRLGPASFMFRPFMLQSCGTEAIAGTASKSDLIATFQVDKNRCLDLAIAIWPSPLAVCNRNEEQLKEASTFFLHHQAMSDAQFQ
jgi:hypothetical protein